MKTLKQIRETYGKNHLGCIPEMMIFEDTPYSFSSSDKKRSDKKSDSISKASPIPSAKEMPVMLIFRRVQFKVFPDRQVVALYYSKMVDKYLSIPFGPGGNLNLSESRIYNNLQELTDAEERENAGAEKNYGWKENVPGYVDQKKAAGNWKRKKYGQALKYGVRSVGKKALTAAGAGLAGIYGAAAGAAALRAAKGAATSAAGYVAGNAAVGAAKKASDTVDNMTKGSSIGNNKPNITKVQGKSSWSKPGSQNSVHASKMKQANAVQAKKILKNKDTVSENKISDLQKMINEGLPVKEFNINGRSITLNNSMAKRILETYSSLNSKNKKIVEEMMNSNVEEFKKLLNFSIKVG